MIFRLIFIVNKMSQICSLSSIQLTDKSVLILLHSDKMKFVNEMNIIVIDILIEYYNFLKKKSPLIVNNIFMIKSYPDIKKRIEEMLHLHLFDEAIEILNLIIETIFFPFEKAKAIELKAIVLFLKDYYYPNSKVLPYIEFNEEVKMLLNDAISYYRKTKEDKFLLEAHFRLITYYSYFKNKISLIRESNRLYSIFYSELFTLNYKIMLFLQCGKLFKEIGMKRKSTLFYFLALIICKNDSSYEKMIPILFNYLNTDLNIYDIKNVMSYEHFSFVHKKIIKAQFNPYEYLILSNDIEGMRTKTEIANKKIEKLQKLQVINTNKELKNVILSSQWYSIQKELYLLMIKYYKDTSQTKEYISMTLSYIQALHQSLKYEELNTVASEFSFLNSYEKFIFYLPLLPLLVKIIPIQSEINFDIIQNENNMKNRFAFIYNPWDRKQTINYFWTKGSSQYISIQLYNPMSIQLIVSNIVVLFDKGENNEKCNFDFPFSFPSSQFTILPKSTAQIINKIRINTSNVNSISIIGIQYEIFKNISKQYVDSNGNGLFYSFNNIFIKNKQKKIFLLKNMNIYPCIPLITVNSQDSSKETINQSIYLFNSQYYTFSLCINNIGKYDIDRLSINVYAYKREDYKVELNNIQLEVFIKKCSSYTFHYTYLHIKSNIKIEFLIFYTSDSYNNGSIQEDMIINPYMSIIKLLNTIEILSFSNLQIIPKTSSMVPNLIINKDIRLSKLNYLVTYMTDEYFLVLTMNNLINCNIKLNIMNDQEQIANNSCKGKSIITVLFKLKTIKQYINTRIDWFSIPNIYIRGSMMCNQILFFNKLFDNHSYLFSDITLKHNRENNSFIIKYIVINQSMIAMTNLKIFLYIYQDYNNLIIFNDELTDKMFYEGSFEYTTYFHSKEKNKYKLVVFPFSQEVFKTTLIIINNEKKEAYMSSNAKEFTLSSICDM